MASDERTLSPFDARGSNQLAGSMQLKRKQCHQLDGEISTYSFTVIIAVIEQEDHDDKKICDYSPNCGVNVSFGMFSSGTWRWCSRRWNRRAHVRYEAGP